MLAVRLGFGTDAVPLLVMITKNEYIWIRKLCTNSFALRREEGAGPRHETSGLVKKGQSTAPGCGLEPELLEHCGFGDGDGKGAEAEAQHGFERPGAAGAGQGPGAAAEQCPRAPLPPPARGLTAFVGVAVFSGALVQSLLLSVMVLISFAVSAGTGADPSLERSPSQDLAAGRRGKSVTVPAWEAHRGSVQLRNRTSKAPPVPLRERIAQEGDGAPRGAGRRAPQQSLPGGRGAPGAEEGSSCRGRSQCWPGSLVPPCQPFS